MTTPEEAMQLEAAKKDLMRKILTKEALERLARVKLTNPIVASNLENYLIQVYQSGQLDGQINDSKLKQILSILTEQGRKKTKIRRK